MNYSEVAEISHIWNSDQMWKRRTASGVHGQTHGRRNKRPNLRVTDGVNPPVTIRIREVSIEVPGSWFKKSGQLKKSKITAYEELVRMAKEALV